MIPIPLPTLILAASVAASAAGGFYAGHRWVTSDWEQEKAEQAHQRADAEREARRIEQARQRGANEVMDAYTKTTRQAQARATAARADADSLRDKLATISAAASAPDAACGVERERVRVLAELVGEAARMAEESTGALGKCDAQNTALRGFIGALRVGDQR